MIEDSKVAVIGSGLSAVGAIKSLVNLGIRPTVLDWGTQLEPERNKLKKEMASKSHHLWTLDERLWLDKNESVNSQSSIPKKMAFGSDYFYGKSRQEAPIKNLGNLPPLSYALGGLSCGWGAAVLPAQDCDLHDWPIDAEELNEYSKIILKDLPFSADDDGLSLNFPLLVDQPHSIKGDTSTEIMLNLLNKSSLAKKDSIVFGKSRLLVQSKENSQKACQYCGQCMSGCVYGAIYKSGDDILKLTQENKIEYLPNCLVDRIEECNDQVLVHYFDNEHNKNLFKFDRIFLACGAVNSSRIVLKSLKHFNKKVNLKSRGGFVVPIFSFKKLERDWPNCNTQPSIFLELKGVNLKHWVHTQISLENELFRQKLNIQPNEKGVVSKLKNFLFNHTFLILVNFHSDYSGDYELQLDNSNAQSDNQPLLTTHKKKFPPLKIIWFTAIKLTRVFLKIGCFPMFPLAKMNSGSYHVGSTFPMSNKPQGDFSTDVLGRVNKWQKTHIVDTSIFPSLPGTTIGLLAMANAYRIVKKVFCKIDTEVNL